MKYLYRTYQLLIALPLIAIYTLITSLMVIIGCTLGNGHFWGYYPGKWWAQFIIRILLLPVKVEGRENLVKGQSYVFVANHQGAFDIFLIYGFLSRNFKWMMKRQLRQMPFVGKACESAHHIFVDKRGASKIRETYDRARQTLQGGMSLVVFPEGARSFTGHMGVFKRGAFMLADDIELPVVPLTINGSFDIMPRTRDMKWVVWHPLRLTIHKPILPVGKGTDNIKYLEEESYKVVMGGLEKQYQGFVENPDQ
ncbi:Acyltransferase [Leyella stercorea DSM 18206]|uniref:Acyltransferase n=1 Tax=Leyella stercorea DSM 18206 TaxID=1002367 RepID=G6AY76_9BACT|nr:lysophospholipid acyltransferase family protein [Leyella stercorea]EHJ39642.1 Acyltransferase [Leyella stercorea DSM 18206]